jgi:5-methylthioadenosine/S-adenosylhomocysteine deaminase
MRAFCGSFLLLATLASAETVDSIWSAAYVVTQDGRHQVIEHGAVAVRGEQIVAVGTKREIDARYQAKRHLDRPEAILIPGLVNTHTHAPMSLMRGIADDLRLQEWLEKHIFPAEARNVTAEYVLWGTRLACLEMTLSGTTTFTDMYFFEDQVAEAAKEAGMRGVLGETMIGFPTPDSKTPQDALAYAAKFLERYKNDRLIVPAIAPHALYTNSPEDLKAARALANQYGAPMLIHLSETKRENDDMQAKYGMSPTRYLDSIGLWSGRSLAAHGIWLDAEDRRILRERGVGVAHCPSSNMKLASGIAPVTAMLAEGMNVGLGPDGPAGSNNDFDMFEEMNLAADLQKVATGDPRSLNAQQAVDMATILGARALGMDKEIGSLAAGKRADMVMVRIDQPHAVPMYNVYSQLVYALKASDVEDVMINGVPVVESSRSLRLNSAAILARAREYRKSVSASMSP